MLRHELEGLNTATINSTIHHVLPNTDFAWPAKRIKIGIDGIILKVAPVQPK